MVADYRQILDQYVRRSDEIYSGLGDLEMDIVLPVYNSFSLLPRCIESIEHTSIRYRLILMDDASTDPRTVKFLKDYAQSHSNVRLIRSEHNIGTIKTINRGLIMTRNHVVILNTDVVLPEGWLERLAAPLIKDPTVASCTPISNLGIITGFPQPGVENQIFQDLPVDMVDECFRQLRSLYTTIPMGDGFCMALNRSVIKKIGILDQQTFEENYGCSREWCIRAAQAGYRNVAVENLYVFHGHTGVYRPEEHRRMDEQFTRRILEKHPGYSKLLTDYFKDDKLVPVRAYVFTRLTSQLSNRGHLIFGSQNKTAYYQRYVEDHQTKGDSITYVWYDFFHRHYLAELTFQGQKQTLQMRDLGGVFHFSDLLKTNTLLVEDLRNYPDLFEHQKAIRRYAEKAGARLVAAIHDYYPLCPGVTLIGEDGKYCHLPAQEECEKCLAQMDLSHAAKIPSMEEWRSHWKRFLESCQEIRIFSEDSLFMLKKIYESLEQLHIVSEQNTRFPRLKRRFKNTDYVNVALLGPLGELEGLEMVKSLVRTADMKNLNIRFFLFGDAAEKISSKHFKEISSFRFSQLPNLMLQHDIDMILYCSLRPEVYSVQVRTAIDMGLPVASLPIGAAQQQVRRYQDGLLIEATDPGDILGQLMAFARGQGLPKSKQLRHYLFLYQDDNFSMRFRLQHLREQLLEYGVSTDIKHVSKVWISELKHYQQILIYDCSWSRKLSRIYDYADRNGIEMWFSISNLDPEDKQFHPGMERSRGCLVPDESLRIAVRQKYKYLRTLVQKNAVSYEMQTLANEALQKKEKNLPQLTFGYINVDVSQQEDLEMIAPVLQELMSEREDFRLKLIGNPEIPESLKYYDTRIDTVTISSWLEIDLQMTDISYLLIPHSAGFAPVFWHMDSRPLEAALMEVPAISDASYADIRVLHGDWKTALLEALDNPGQAARLGSAARQRVLETSTTEYLEPEIRKIFGIRVSSDARESLSRKAEEARE